MRISDWSSDLCSSDLALQTLASGQRQRQSPSVVIVARRLLLATANGSQNSPTGAATYRPSKLTPTGHRNRRATVYAERAMQMSWAESPLSPLAILSRCLLSLRKDTYGIT